MTVWVGDSPTMRLAFILLSLLSQTSALAVSSPAARRRAASRPMVTLTPARMQVDWVQTAKYPAATAVQFGLMATLFKAIDAVGNFPAPLVPPLFAFLSLRSRIFSMLSANRPPRGGFEVDGKRVATPKETIRPSWTPPGVAFPIIWLTITALRATSTFLVFESAGRVLCSTPILLLALHLSVGDTWNCVTNVVRPRSLSIPAPLPRRAQYSLTDPFPWHRRPYCRNSAKGCRPWACWRCGPR